MHNYLNGTQIAILIYTITTDLHDNMLCMGKILTSGCVYVMFSYLKQFEEYICGKQFHMNKNQSNNKVITLNLSAHKKYYCVE